MSSRKRLGELYEEYEVDPDFEHMRRAGSIFVPGVGNPDAPDLLFLGEAPGRQENAKGEPFVGSSGRLLWAACDLIFGEGKVDCWTTNVVKYRPVDDTGRNRTPTEVEISASRPYLRQEVITVRPRVIVPLGGSALACVDYGPAKGRLRRGSPTEMGSWLYLPLWHPSFVLRRGGLDSGTGRQFVQELRHAAWLTKNGVK